MKYIKIMLVGASLLGLVSGAIAASKQEASRLTTAQMKQVRGESMTMFQWNGSRFVIIKSQYFMGPNYEVYLNSDGSTHRVTQDNRVFSGPGSDGQFHVRYQSPLPPH